MTRPLALIDDADEDLEEFIAWIGSVTGFTAR